MLDPLELQVFPSSYNCVSWSEDGEIAVAANEYVHILTPKVSSKNKANGTPPHFSSADWHRTRFRANVFTTNEWPVMFPQPRDNFSVGAEQSLSTVVGVAWSPPGLAKYRRSVLAVLTSNMVLSLYALSGTSERWLRIAIVNQALEIFFRESIENNTLTTRFQSFFRRDAEDKSPRTRKTNIRAFSWTPPLKVPAKNQLYSGPESRWGVPLVTVANDDNDLVFLQVQQPESQQGSSGSLDVEAVSSIHLPASPSYGQVLQPGSILSSALQTQVRMSSLTSGPWIYEPGGSGQDAISATVNVAALQGMKLRVAKFTVGVELRAHDSDGGLRYSLTFDVVENNAMPLARLEEFQCTGPMHWAHKMDSGSITMTVGARTGVALLGLPEDVYRGQKSETSDSHVLYYPLLDDSTTGTTLLHQERISGMTVAIDPESETPVLHFGSVGGYAAVKALTDREAPSRAPWNGQVEDIRERFDIDRDLGGLAIARVWGLASIHGLVAAVVTLHPGDMVEYRTNAEERLTVLFSTASGQPLDLESYILGDHAGTKNALSPKVLYAAACCAIVQSQKSGLVSSAQRVLERLAATSDVDMTAEIAKCSAPGSTIEPRSTDILNAPGGDIFERYGVTLTNDTTSPVQPDFPGNPRAWNFKVLLQV
ncbi:hypothetical protein ASPSYDRAFT_161355 [Aspergillus sydowii CBS 593.65]|uniref:Transcription factor IIIC 90kDa subunit N-terminal domain-containing protein n=1 Tax=Aspergillus sydowii CBS 593.65 TaxID=1036612 RepID=A0A1L9T482_9EURO|nr:uncharacterized protein ASPSYDRAFT_161355 [Aspergillus sydowii CBS 593.65]OJJ54242.1 hypothetical protein ASPSYDRAFT_161355 [Aspergillus sydowii CBS 593.65]